MEETTYVSSKVLIGLQTELKNLSDNLKDLYDALSQALTSVHDGWQDGKYDDFINEFRSSKEMVIELSDKYKEWATVWLPPRIEQAILWEGTGTSINR